MIDLSLSIQFADTQHRALLKRAMLKRWVMLALQGGDVPQAEITLRFVDAAESSELNKSYRNKHYATNVLTFDYAREPVLMADIVICSAIIAKEAAEQGKELIAHYAHMTVHGVLHARGFDHVVARDAKQMEALEVQLMKNLGYNNPYTV